MLMLLHVCLLYGQCKVLYVVNVCSLKPCHKQVFLVYQRHSGNVRTVMKFSGYVVVEEDLTFPLQDHSPKNTCLHPY